MSEMQLPQLVLEVTGQVVSTNLDVFKASAKDFIDSIKTDLHTDDDFIEAESAVKVCKDAEDRIETAKSAAISRMATVEELFKVVDEIKEEIRAKRLILERTVKNRKDQVRTEIVEEAYQGLLDHRERTFESTGYRISIIKSPLIDAMRGKKTVRTCREAVEFAASAMRENITRFATNLSINRKALVSDDGFDRMFLFPDFDEAGLHDPAIFSRFVAERTAEHEAAEKAAEEQRQAKAAELKAAMEAKRKAQEEAERKAREEERARELVQAEARRIAEEEAEAKAQQSRLMQAEEERRQQLIEESLMRRVESEKANEPDKAPESPAIDRSDDTWSAFGVLGGEVTEFDVAPPRKQDNSYEAYNAAAFPACDIPAADIVDDFMKVKGIDSDKVRSLLKDFVAYYEAARF